MDFRFATPQALLLLAAIPLLMWAIRYWGTQTGQRLFSFTRLAVRQVSGRRKGEFNQQTVSLLLALILGIFALARPQGNPTFEEQESQALDIMVLLDLSRSMAAEDAYPSRLQKAKRSISTMLGKLAGDRVGLVGFAGSAVLISPLTSDYEIIRNFLAAASTDTIENQGTNVEAAMHVAMDAFKRGSTAAVRPGDRSHVVILFSDGEMNSGESENAIKAIKEYGVRVFAVAYGDPKGTPIPIRDHQGNLQTFKKDRRGNTVMTSMDIKPLEELSAAGGGRAYISSVDDAEIGDIVNAIAGLDRSEVKKEQVRIYSEFYFLPLTVAVLLLAFAYGNLNLPKIPGGSAAIVFGFCLGFVPRTAAASDPQNALAKTAPNLAPGTQSQDFFGDSTRRKSAEALKKFQADKAGDAAKILQEMQIEDPDSPEIAYSLGTALLKSGKVEEGRRLLDAVPSLSEKRQNNDDLTFLSAFNLAGSYAEQKDYATAAERYASLIEALKQKENRSRNEEEILKHAKNNLELMAKEEEKKQQQAQQNQDQNNKEEQDPKNEQQRKDQGSQNKDDQSNQSQSQDESSQNKDDKNQKGQESEAKKDADQKQKEAEDKQKEQERARSRIGFNRKKFQENETLSEADAKKILEALKQQEQLLQRKFLRSRSLDRQDPNSNDKDW